MYLLLPGLDKSRPQSVQGLIDVIGLGNVSTEHLLEQLKVTLQLSQSVTTA